MWKWSLLYLFVLTHVVTVFCDDRCAMTRETRNAIGINSDEPSSEYSIQMCNASRYGLPKCLHCKNIAIIGAGVAGLTAAVELALAGHRVTIYEASNRTGGRILTHRVPGTNFLTELGAMRLPLDVHPLLQTYIDQRYDLEIAEFVNSNPNAYVYINNVLQTVRKTDEQPNAFGFVLNPDENGMTADQLWNRATQPLIDMINTKGQNAFHQKWGSYSVGQYLYSTNMSRGAMDYIGLMLNVETNLHTALTESIADMTIIKDDTMFYHIVGGNDLLTDKLKDECLRIPDGRCKIFYDSRIVTVELNEQQPYDVRMEFVTNSSLTSNSTDPYESVIVATTATAAETIQFKNRDRFIATYRALRQVHYDCASKIALFFNESWWITKQTIRGGRSTTDLPIRFTYYHNFNLNDTGGAALIGSYTWSQDSILWQSLSDEVALKLAVDNLDTLHKDIDIRPYYCDGTTKHWCDDLYAHGAFALFTPDQELHIKHGLRQSVGNVHFIGEHTSTAHGWIEGSILSALRIALIIQEEYFDVAIIGSGPIGLATAINLASRNSSLRIIVIDQSYIGNSEGSSGSSDTRQFRQMYDEQYLAELAHMSVQFWKDLETNASLPEGSLLNTDQGYLFFGDPDEGETTEGDLKNIEQNCIKLSMDCLMLNGTDLQRRFPFFHVPPSYQGVFHQNSGYINVTALMNALQQLANKKNIMIRTGETFLGLDQSIAESASYVRLFTDRGSLNATKVIFAPGPFARNVSEKLGFILHMTIWELPVLYFQLRITNSTIPTWFAFGGDKQSLYYGFSKESSDRPGYVKISPDFITDMSNPLIYPNQRKNVVDPQLIQRTKDWVSLHVQMVDSESYQNAPSTCLATFLPDNGFLIDYLPSRIRYHDKLIMYAAGWGMKFVPLWADVLAEITLDPNSPKYVKYMAKFSFDIDGRYSYNNTVPPSSAHHLTMIDNLLFLFSMLNVIFVIKVRTN